MIRGTFVRAAAGATRTLKLVQIIPTGGSIPSNLKIDPTGRYLPAANQKTNNIAVFSVDSKTGRLTPTTRTINAPAPACIVFAPAL